MLALRCKRFNALPSLLHCHLNHRNSARSLTTFAALQAQNVCSFYSPAGWIQTLISVPHLTLGVPWWLSFMLTGTALSLLFTPFSITISHSKILQSHFHDKLDGLSKAIASRRSGSQDWHKLNQKRSAFIKKHKLVAPGRVLMASLVPAVAFFVSAMAIRSFVKNVDEMKKAGFGEVWCDLGATGWTKSSEWGIFGGPMLNAPWSAVMSVLAIQIAKTRTKAIPTGYLYLGCGLSFIVSSVFLPTGTLLFANSMLITQFSIQYLLMHPRVGRFFVLPIAHKVPPVAHFPILKPLSFWKSLYYARLSKTSQSRSLSGAS